MFCQAAAVGSPAEAGMGNTIADPRCQWEQSTPRTDGAVTKDVKPSP